jgi:hypothetical protein
MKTFKFSVIETWLGGVKPKEFREIKARTLKSAWNKVLNLQGNRMWHVEFVGEI